jgi:hypothetical protein
MGKSEARTKSKKTKFVSGEGQLQILTGASSRQTVCGFDSVSRHFVSISLIFGATKFT